jgi:hypothetical protein
MKNTKKELFNPKHLDCCIEIGDCRLENPPKELMDKLIGQPISNCKKIIEEFLKPKEKLVIKFRRKIGYETPHDNR